MNLTKQQIDTIGEIVHSFCRKPKTNSLWHLFDDEDKQGMYEHVELAVLAAKSGLGTQYIHDTWCAIMLDRGFFYGEIKTGKKHPLLVDFAILPPEQRMKLGILYAFTKRVMEYWEEKGELKQERL